MSEQMTVKQLMENMPSAFQPQNAQNDYAIIQYKLAGQGGGEWYLTVNKGTCAIAEGVSEAAQVTMTMTAEDYFDLATGKLNGMNAVMSGKLKVTGNMGLLMKMQSWFKQ
jgi:putative sterol carrier protein